MIDLREAVLSDHAAITALLAQAHLVTEGVLAPDTRYWMAVDEMQACVGVIGAEFGPYSVLLRSALVQPEVRKQSIGSRLVRHLFEHRRGELLAATRLL